MNKTKSKANSLKMKNSLRIENQEKKIPNSPQFFFKKIKFFNMIK